MRIGTVDCNREDAMRLPRRQFLHLAAGAAALPFAPHVARAQGYPTRPARIMWGVSAGAGADLTARLVAQWLSERMGQQFIVENRVGGNGLLAREAVVRAPDGYTLLLATATDATNATLTDQSYNFLRDIAPVSGIVLTPFVMVVNPSFAPKTVPEFIAYAKANPGKINMGSTGAGNVNHLFGELFKAMANVDLQHVPYRGGAPALTDLLGGQIQVLWTSLAAALQYIKAGTLRPLAVTTSARSDALPDIPTIGESVPGYEAVGWFGMGASRSAPPDVVAMLNNEINLALADPKMKSKFAALGGIPHAVSASEFGNCVSEAVEKWAKLIRATNIKAG